MQPGMLNGNGAKASVISAAIVVALFAVMLPLFLGVNSRCATNTTDIARVEEREEIHYEQVIRELREIKALVRELER